MVVLPSLRGFINPSYWEYLHRTDPSNLLVRDYFQPGVWLLSSSSTQEGRYSVGASLVVSPPIRSNNTTSSSTTITSASRGGLLFVEKTIGETEQRGSCVVGVQTGTEVGDNSMTGVWKVHPAITLVGGVHSPLRTAGWMGVFGNFSLRDPMKTRGLHDTEQDAYYYRNNPFAKDGGSSGADADNSDNSTIHIQLGSWIPWGMQAQDRKEVVKRRKDYAEATTTRSETMNWLGSSVRRVHGYAALQMLGTTSVVEAQFPNFSGSNGEGVQLPEIRSYFSIDLVGDERGAGSGKVVDPLSGAGGGGGPPMRVALERNFDGSSAMSLCQIFTFDRYQFNPLEDRAPRVRNTAGWTVRMTKKHNDSSAQTDEGVVGADVHRISNQSPSTTVELAGAWQMNRSVAIKAVAQPADNTFTAALLLKRWAQPRVTCSLLFGNDRTSSQFRFLGIGLELKTEQQPMPQKSSGNSSSGCGYYGNAENSKIHLGDTPETKVTLPPTKAALPDTNRSR